MKKSELMKEKAQLSIDRLYGEGSLEALKERIPFTKVMQAGLSLETGEGIITYGLLTLNLETKLAKIYVHFDKTILLIFRGQISSYIDLSDMEQTIKYFTRLAKSGLKDKYRRCFIPTNLRIRSRRKNVLAGVFSARLGPEPVMQINCEMYLEKLNIHENKQKSSVR